MNLGRTYFKHYSTVITKSLSHLRSATTAFDLQLQKKRKNRITTCDPRDRRNMMDVHALKWVQYPLHRYIDYNRCIQYNMLYMQ